MKALILSAGLGTRLLPHTRYLPKALFRVGGKPVLRIMIEKLAASGCDSVFINTHHLHDQIEQYIRQSDFPVPVRTVFEPVLLDTGGAIANLKEELSSGPFFVVNGDILTDFNLTALWDFHLKGNQMATLALHYCPEFNKIEVDADGNICSFTSATGRYAFTGIQVLSNEIFCHMPPVQIFSSIDLYTSLLDSRSVKACIFDSGYWTDIGTPLSFTRACIEHISSAVLTRNNNDPVDIRQIAGDGSDRCWYRIRNQKKSYVVCDHGICLENNNDTDAYTAFIKIGNHLLNRHIPVPRIIARDRFPGLVVLEDLGDTHLEKVVKPLSGTGDIMEWYKKVCDVLYRFSQAGIKNFNTDWTYQTRIYDKSLILEKECRYFFNEFVLEYVNLDVSFDDYEPEFAVIADKALENGFSGLMHRDFQSRNIMIRDQHVYLIDFQSARIGPVQYDLASLLIDPYAGLSDVLQEQIFDYFYHTYISGPLMDKKSVDPERFRESFLFCRITRNLQILGAFSFLSRVKQKKFFENYIPAALGSLKKHLYAVNLCEIPRLYQLVQTIIEGTEKWQKS